MKLNMDGSFNTLDEMGIDDHKARPAQPDPATARHGPPATRPAWPDRHFVPGRAVLARRNAWPIVPFKISLFSLCPLWAVRSIYI